MRYHHHSRKGGAALAAVLIMIILIAAGTAIMLVTGKGQIKEAEDVPTVAPVDTSSEPEEDSSIEPVVSEPEPEPEPEKFPQPTEAANYEEIDFKKLDLTTKYAILVDCDKNEIVAGVNYDKQIFPASLTKVMTIIVAVENLEDKDVQYKFTQEEIDPMIEENASRAGFEPGESVTFEDLLYASILVSGADGTHGLAMLTAGSEEKFVDMMNEKAAQLGLESTYFKNASGLHDDDHFTTCKDMAVLLEYALQNETCRKVLTTPMYTTSETEQHPEGIQLYSIVASRTEGYWVDCDGDGTSDADILGGKTGFTDEAGFAIETILDKDGKTYICVTAKSTTQFSSIEDNIAIYEYYLGDHKAPADTSSDESTAEDASSEGSAA